MTLYVDISCTIFGNVSAEPGAVLTGTAIHRTAAQFGTATGNDYVDDVAVPFAQASGASNRLFLTADGTLTNLGYPISATLVATDVGGVQINQGMSDAWFDPATAGQGFFIIAWPDCENAELGYDIPGLGLSGDIDLIRIVADNVALCEAPNQ